MTNTEASATVLMVSSRDRICQRRR